MEARDVLIYLSLIHKGDVDCMLKDIQDKKDINCVDVENAVRDVASYKIVTILDSYYPPSLKLCFKPPLVLYYKGDISLLKSDKILSVIGSRDPSLECTNAAKILLDKTPFVTINGGCVGTDTDVFWIVDKTIIVLPCGLDYKGTETALVEDVIKKGGLVISEYPLDTPPSKDSCARRNLIIESIANKTLVLESNKNSAATLRVTVALSLGHDVLVVPKTFMANDIYINNELIQEGANICLSKGDLEN